MNPTAIRIEAAANATTPASTCARATYTSVEAASVATLERNETLRPNVSAITPVGTSNRTVPSE